MELLKDEADFFRAHPIEFVGRNARNVLPVEPDFSRTRSVQAANQVHRRGFARSRRAHDRQPFAGLYVKRNIIQSANHAAATTGIAISASDVGSLSGVELGDILDLNHLTLPLRWLLAALAAKTRWARWPPAKSLLCYQP